MLLEVFDYVYIINLPHRADRKAEIQEQLTLAGVNVKDPRVVFFAASRPEDKGEFESIGARGCFLSHLGVIRMAIASGARRFLILEDDCNFSKGVQAQFAGLASYLQSDSWTIFYGGALEVSGLQDGPIEHLAIVPAIEGVMGAHCVGMQGAVAPRLADYLEAMLRRPGGHPEGGPMHVDGAYSWFRRAHADLKTVLSVPEIAYQRSSQTNIGPTKWFEVPALNKTVALLRRLKNRFLPRGI